MIARTMTDLIARAAHHVSDILRDAIQLQPAERAVIIYDTESPLARIITDGYRAALPHGDFVDFGAEAPEQIIARVKELRPRDLVVLVQSSNFRLNEFRFRIELFKRDLKTIEHLHLNRLPEEQWPIYIESLAYDANMYRPLGRSLKSVLDTCSEIVVECPGTTLIYEGGMEPTKLNVGDYSDMKNVGGSFPIGEVFTEARDLTRANGDAMVFAFAGDDHHVQIVEPFRVHVAHGILTPSAEAPEAFKKIIDMIKQDEEVLVRELGLGLNPAMGKHALVSDITAFERQKGMHVSLGAKHAIYPKPGLHRKKGRYHIDIFIDITRITADGAVLYADGDFRV